MPRRTTGSRSSSVNRSSHRNFGSSSRPQQQQPVPTTTHTPTTPVVVSSGPGLLGQMVSTAAGVAMGSTIGHTVGGIITHGLFGSSSDRDEIAASSSPTNQTMMSSNPSTSSLSTDPSRICSFQSKQLAECLQQSGNDISLCEYYLTMLNQCRQQILNGNKEDLSFA
jgi:coiled-coil-helix-coiled-coil-helix domain-containing protein 2